MYYVLPTYQSTKYFVYVLLPSSKILSSVNDQLPINSVNWKTCNSKNLPLIIRYSIHSHPLNQLIQAEDYVLESCVLHLPGPGRFIIVGQRRYSQIKEIIIISCFEHETKLIYGNIVMIVMMLSIFSLDCLFYSRLTSKLENHVPLSSNHIKVLYLKLKYV